MSKFTVEIVLALPGRQLLKEVLVTPGDSVADVVSMSGLHEVFPECEIDALALGIWGRAVNREQLVKAGDRVELYRPLELDPRAARRQLALGGKTMGSANQD